MQRRRTDEKRFEQWAEHTARYDELSAPRGSEHVPRDDRSPVEMQSAVRRDCERIATVAQPDDSTLALAAKVPELSTPQVRRRVEALERDLGLTPAPLSERGGGRRPREGERQHSRPYRRAGSVALSWKRFRSEDCL